MERVRIVSMDLRRIVSSVTLAPSVVASNRTLLEGRSFADLLLEPVLRLLFLAGEHGAPDASVLEVVPDRGIAKVTVDDRLVGLRGVPEDLDRAPENLGEEGGHDVVAAF